MRLPRTGINLDAEETKPSFFLVAKKQVRMLLGLSLCKTERNYPCHKKLSSRCLNGADNEVVQWKRRRG